MQTHEHEYYEKIGNWDFSQIKYIVEKENDWDFYNKIKENSNEKSVCLDLGTGGGEKVLKYYPKVKKIIATDFSHEMIDTANKNLSTSGVENVEFKVMDNLKIEFPDETFDVISARHTIINAEEIYRCLKPNGVLVIEGVDKEDCQELKDVFGRGQAYNDEIAISQKDYSDLKNAGFENIKFDKIIEYEYYETEEDLLALLLKTPILDDFSELDNTNFTHNKIIEPELFKKYVETHKTEKGIELKRLLYGIVAKK